jgi:3-hydroxyisobutyrate dehydrogenase-like beta-hydroxyacid dehydrogenase
MKNESISILGCGWLGLPLAGELVREGYAVKGSTNAEWLWKTTQVAGPRTK